MAGTARGHKDRHTIGKQSAEGTPQATSDYEMSVVGGGIEPNRTESAYEVTDTDDITLGYYAQRADSMGDPSFELDVAGCGLPWKLHLGAEALTGAGDPWTHTITKQDAPLFGTIYRLRPDVLGGTDRWERLEDGFVKSVEVAFTAGQPLTQKLEVIGKAHTFNPSAPTITNDRRVGATNTQLLSMIGATLSIDPDSATPVQTRAVESGSVVSAFADAAWIQTDELKPRYLHKGPYSCGVSLTAVFENFDAFLNYHFGTTTLGASMAQSAVVNLGSVELAFSVLPTVSAGREMKITIPSGRWMAVLPKGQPNGDAVRVTLTHSLAKNQGGESITVAIKNARSSAY